MKLGEKYQPLKVTIFTKFHDDWTKKCVFFTNGQFLIVGPFLTKTLLYILAQEPARHQNYKVRNNVKVKPSLGEFL